MLNFKKTRIIFHIFLIAAFIAFAGCDKKTETEKQSPVENQDTAADSAVAEQINKTPELVGTWSGKFDNRSTTLKITEQNGNQFKGKISIAYREAINQDVSGTIDTSSNSITMKDLLHSRYMGKYNGKLSEDNTTFSGTFTMNLDGKKFPFNLKKK